MPVWAIIVIGVVVVLALIALIFALPRARERARVKRRERELERRREQVISEHREEAESRTRRAEEAEQRARIAEQEARREREEARLREEQAALHERGMADHELVADHEREEFAGTSADLGTGTSGGPDVASSADERHGGVGATRQAQDGPTSAYDEGRRAAREPERAEDFQQGRSDELEGDENKSLLGRLRGRSS